MEQHSKAAESPRTSLGKSQDLAAMNDAYMRYAQLLALKTRLLWAISNCRVSPTIQRRWPYKLAVNHPGQRMQRTTDKWDG